MNDRFKRMKEKMKKVSLMPLVLIIFPVGLIAQIVETTGSISVMSGEYTVSNNVWGATTPQTLDVDTSGTYFKVVLSGHNNTGGTPAAYPFIYKGCHYGTCTKKNNPMPMGIGEIGSAPFTWVISTAGVSGAWNCAYESWFNDPTVGTNYTGELMIWINYNGGVGPAGSQVGTVNIDGHTWNVFFGHVPTWNYITYKITSVTDSVSLDFKDFIHDALTRGYLYTTWNLNNMEAGFEIWRDGTGLTANSYSASVIGGGSPENYAPVPFLLSSPANNKNLTSMTIPFNWLPSIDPNLDYVEYIFHLFGQNFDTTIAQISDTSLVFDGKHCLQPYTLYTWYVEATDGTDTTKSTTQRTFRTPRSTGVNLLDENPHQFFLNQNYPNPFNPTTTIEYQILLRQEIKQGGQASPFSEKGERGGFVSLKVYDILGREVTTLVNEVKQTGNYTVTWDAANLPSEVYFCRLQAEKYIATKEMVLIK